MQARNGLTASDALADGARAQGGPGLVLVDRAYEAVLRPVRTGNAFEETVERLLTAIKLGIAAPGTRLPPERELAERLSVSRVTLREAIRALHQSGYVDSRRGRYGGTFVNSVLPKLNKTVARRLAKQTRADLEDTLVVRRVLEVGAAAEAADHRPVGADALHLTSCLGDCGSATDIAGYRRRDSRLHLAVAEVTGSPSLTAAVARTRMRVNGFLDAIPLIERNIQHSERQHAEIVAAILAGDRQQARQAMEGHLSATAALLRGFLG
jgi:DNA-binding FadR family transcriptional regulator